MKKIVSALILSMPLLSFANGIVQTPGYALEVTLGNNYSGPMKDDIKPGISEEYRNGFYQQIAFFHPKLPQYNHKDAVAGAMIVTSQSKITPSLLMSETLGWLMDSSIKTIPCPSIKFSDFTPNCYIKTLNNEVRDSTFIIYSAISSNQYDGIILFSLVGQSTNYNYDYRTVSEPSYKSATTIFDNLIHSVKLINKIQQ